MKMKRAVFGLLLLVPLALQAQTQATSPTSDERQVRDSVIMQSTLYFDSNVCENIPSSQYYKMAVFLKSVKQNLNTKVRIVGWTDNVGASDFNKQFALKRAQSMKGYLIRQGVASERISILGEGIDTHAASGNKARRVDMTQIVELVLVEAPVSPQVMVEQPQEQPSPIEPTPLQQPEFVQEQKQSVAEPAQQRPVVESTSTNAAYRWYAGIELGVPVAVSTFSSFASHGGAGFEGGVLAGYRFSPLLSAEVGISLGTMRLGSNKCCGEYFLGADGGRYLEHVAGMKSYSYNDIYSSVSVQQYALRLNVDMLQIVNPDWNKRWSLILSPAIYGIGTKATLRQSGSEDKIIRRDGQFQFAAGATIGGGYQITRNLGVGLRTGMVWVMGDHFDGIAPSDHSENMIWNNTVTFTWRFGRNK